MCLVGRQTLLNQSINQSIIIIIIIITPNAAQLIQNVMHKTCEAKIQINHVRKSNQENVRCLTRNDSKDISLK